MSESYTIARSLPVSVAADWTVLGDPRESHFVDHINSTVVDGVSLILDEHRWYVFGPSRSRSTFCWILGPLNSNYTFQSDKFTIFMELNSPSSAATLRDWAAAGNGLETDLLRQLLLLVRQYQALSSTTLTSVVTLVARVAGFVATAELR